MVARTLTLLDRSSHRPARRRISAPSLILLSTALAALLALSSSGVAQQAGPPGPEATADLEVTDARVRLIEDLSLLVFEQDVVGTAGGTVAEARGQLDGAPVLGYVFPTSLRPGDVGFAPGEGVVALAATSHPDFDDTPLWDENRDGTYGNDGVRFHTHWVVLVEDDRVDGGLAVKAARSVEEELPPTNPGMSIYLDSPGFSVVFEGETLRVLVPLDRVRGRDDFTFDAVTAYMEVNTSDDTRPTLGVYRIYEVLSGDLSLPYRVERERMR